MGEKRGVNEEPASKGRRGKATSTAYGQGFYPAAKQKLTGRVGITPLQNRVRPWTDAHERQGWRGASSEVE